MRPQEPVDAIHVGIWKMQEHPPQLEHAAYTPYTIQEIGQGGGGIYIWVQAQ